MKYLIALLSVLSFAADKPKLIGSELIATSKPGDWRALRPENTLYMELPAGRVVIELAPDFAPNHVANIKALARENYWDGLAIVRVQDNYVVQWADPNADKPNKRAIKNAKATLPAEFDGKQSPAIPFAKIPDKDVYAPETGFAFGFPVGRDPKQGKIWLLHCYGMVGVGRDVAADSGGGAELYAVIGHSPRHLDRNVTLVGRVIDGMEFLSGLPRGHAALGFYEKPEQNIPIKSIRLASDVPEKERSSFEILRTDTPLFQKVIEAKRYRVEDWFHYQAGHVEACNVNVPARKK
jgi:cyclophilin family peptidyl-prolyl cis-trans isomerase